MWDALKPFLPLLAIFLLNLLFSKGKDKEKKKSTELKKAKPKPQLSSLDRRSFMEEKAKERDWKSKETKVSQAPIRAMQSSVTLSPKFVKEASKPGLSFQSRSDLQKAFLYKEIFGPPRAKRTYRIGGHRQ